MASSSTQEAFYLDLAAFILRSKQHIMEVGEHLSLTGVQVMTLLFIDTQAAPTMSKLCKQFDCDAGNMTGIIDGLEQKGLVSRRPDSKDRRVKIIDLEPAGQTMQTAIMERLVVSGDSLLSPLTPTETSQLAGLLHKLAA